MTNENLGFWEKAALRGAVRKISRYSVDINALGLPRQGEGNRPVAEQAYDIFDEKVRNRPSYFSRVKEGIVGVAIGLAPLLQYGTKQAMDGRGIPLDANGECPVDPIELCLGNGKVTSAPTFGLDTAPETVRTGIVLGTLAVLGTYYAGRKWNDFVDKTVTLENLQAYGEYLMEKRND